MSKDKDVLLSLSALVETESGVAFVHRGEHVPDDVKPEALKRLKRIGAYGVPDEPIVVEQDASAPPVEAEIAVWVSESTATEVVEAADTPERAAELLAAEKAGKNRKTVVDGLTAVIEG